MVENDVIVELARAVEAGRFEALLVFSCPMELTPQAMGRLGTILRKYLAESGRDRVKIQILDGGLELGVLDPPG